MIDKNNPIPDNTFDAGMICTLFAAAVTEPADEDVLQEANRLMGFENGTLGAQLLKAFAAGVNKGLELAIACQADPAQTN